MWTKVERGGGVEVVKRTHEMDSCFNIIRVDLHSLFITA